MSPGQIPLKKRKTQKQPQHNPFFFPLFQQLSLVFWYCSLFSFLNILLSRFSSEVSLKRHESDCLYMILPVVFSHLPCFTFSCPPFDRFISCHQKALPQFFSSSERSNPKRGICYKHDSPGCIKRRQHLEKTFSCPHICILTYRKQLKAVGLYLQLRKPGYGDSEINCKHI